MKSFAWLLLMLVIAICAGCFDYRHPIRVPKPKDYPTHSATQMFAGMGQADLTLPPGYPMSGYCINGRISRGYWIRPKATALYLLDTTGTPFVFVTTDLWAITEGQKMAVLKALANDSNTAFIGESELLLSATHSHHGGGVNEMDKAFASSSIGFGVDLAVFKFTVDSIVAAIKRAVNSREASTVTYAIQTIKGIAKNRSESAYFANPEAERQKYFTGKVEKDRFSRSKAEIQSSVEQKLSVITVRDRNNHIKGILASYPMHPSASGDATEVYSADVFGLAASVTADSLTDHPIVAFYNGAEGDVAPEYTFHHRADVVRIAEKLRNGIVRATNAADQLSMSNDTIVHRTKMANMASNEVRLLEKDSNCYRLNSGSVVRTSHEPVAGASILAGASDGRTSLSSFGISDGIRDTENWDASQGSKMPAVTFVASKTVWRNHIPKILHKKLKNWVKITPRSKVNISIHKVGDVYFTGLPGEFTTMLGRRIRDTLAKIFEVKDSAISLVGLADAYLSYITTECEYEQQFYEGASNFFGMATGHAFIKEYVGLAKEDGDSPANRQAINREYNAGKKVKFAPAFLGDLQVWNAREGLHNLMVSADGLRVASREMPPYDAPQQPIRIDTGEIVAYSFYDRVNKIDAKNFYPEIFILGNDSDTLKLPEHILTVDKYNGDSSLWTVRILRTAKLPTETPLQIIVQSLSGDVVPRSAKFIIQERFAIK